MGTRGERETEREGGGGALNSISICNTLHPL